MMFAVTDVQYKRTVCTCILTDIQTHVILTDKCVYGQTDGHAVRVYGCTYVFTYGQMDISMYVCMDGQSTMYICMLLSFILSILYIFSSKNANCW
jgi:hypothetical protein